MASIEKSEGRLLTLDEVKALQYGQHVYIPCTNPQSKHYARLVSVKVNGAPKTWKTRPNEVRVPWKYGLFEYGYINETTYVYVDKE